MQLSTKLLQASKHHKITICDDMILHNCKIVQRSTKKVIIPTMNETLLDDFMQDFATTQEISHLCKFFADEVNQQTPAIIIDAEVIE